MGILVHLPSFMAGPIAAALREAAPDIPVWIGRENAPADEVEAIIAWGLKPGVVPAYRNLRLICSAAAGVDKLVSAPDLPESMPVTRVVDPGQQTGIAHYVLAMALRHARRLGTYAEQQRRGEWKRHPAPDLAHCRVGVLGMGEIGSAVARTSRPSAFQQRDGAAAARAFPASPTTPAPRACRRCSRRPTSSSARCRSRRKPMACSTERRCRNCPPARLHQCRPRRAPGRTRPDRADRRRPPGRRRARCVFEGAARARRSGVEPSAHRSHAAYRVRSVVSTGGAAVRGERAADARWSGVGESGRSGGRILRPAGSPRGAAMRHAVVACRTIQLRNARAAAGSMRSRGQIT